MIIKIDHCKIGKNQPVFIVAELSGNHYQDYRQAIKLIDKAAKAGADAVKVQTFTPDTITIDSDKKYFQIKVNESWKGQTLYNLYKKTFMPWSWQPKLKKYAEKKKMIFFSTPLDKTAVDFLEKMNVKLYKVGSFEIIDIPLLKRIGRTKKPVIISRGMAKKEEIKLAIKTLKKSGCPTVAVLHCISSYPAQPEEMNLATVPDINKNFGVISGLSDHTLGITMAVCSVGLGTSIIEKHIILSRAKGGPDAGFSLEPDEFKKMVIAVREAEKAIGKPSYKLGQKESENIVFRRSLFVVKDIKKGQKFTENNIRSIRPGHGLAPKYFDKIIGKKATVNIKKGEPLKWKLVR